MAHETRLKYQVRMLRGLGLSINSLVRVHGVAKSTVSLWVRDQELTEEIRTFLSECCEDGRAKGRAVRLKRLELVRQNDELLAAKDIVDLPDRESKIFWRACAAILYWCEGGKSKGHEAVFVNSDPATIAFFIQCLREGYNVPLSDFRARIHLHEYHDNDKQMAFWSRTTGIPIDQFRKSYLKPHTGKRKREGYQGCIAIRGGNVRLARKLIFLYRMLAARYAVQT